MNTIDALPALAALAVGVGSCIIIAVFGRPRQKAVKMPTIGSQSTGGKRRKER